MTLLCLLVVFVNVMQIVSWIIRSGLPDSDNLLLRSRIPRLIKKLAVGQISIADQFAYSYVLGSGSCGWKWNQASYLIEMFVLC